jgi:uridine phosphorylase
LETEARSAGAYLRPTARIAGDAILPGDPALAMALARHLVEAPLMSNHSYGLWGYTGSTSGGQELTIQATGIGGPSAALVLGDLAANGVRRAIRIGFARPLEPALTAGDVLVAEAAIAADGAARMLADGVPVAPDAELSGRLARACGPQARGVTVVSTDLDLGSSPDAGTGAALDLETAAVLAAARRAGVAAAAVLLVGDPDQEAAALALGEACARALAG